MISTSSAYKVAVRQRTREWYPTIIATTASGTTTLTQADIKQGSIRIRETIGDGLGLGGAAMAEFTVTIYDTGSAARADFNGGTVKPAVGLMTTEGLETIPLGVFMIDEARRKKPYFVELHGFDNMSKAERPFSQVQITYPTTIGEIYHKITQFCGITEETTTLPDFASTVATAPRGDLSCRDILAFIAQRSHRIARMTRGTGKLELVELKTPQYITEAGIDGNTTGSADGGAFSGPQTPDVDGGAVPNNTADATIGPNFRFSYSADDAPVIYTGITYTMPQTDTDTPPEVLIYGSACHAIDLTSNPLLYTGTRAEFDTLCEGLAAYIKTAKYQPFSMTYPGDPAIQAGDMIANTDRAGVTQRSTAAIVEFTLRGAGTISATGKSDSEAGYKTNEQKIGNTIATINQTNSSRLNQMQIATQTAATLIAGMSGGYIIDGDTIGGIHAGNIFISDNADINQAVKIWRINLAGMGYSESGINGPFISSITADGQIVARLITADMIRTGNIQAVTGTSFFDLDNARLAARTTAGALTIEGLEEELIVGSTHYGISIERAAWYSITPPNGEAPEVWAEDPDFSFETARIAEDYGEWQASTELTVSGAVDFADAVMLYEGAESADNITFANARGVRGQDTDGTARPLAYISGYNNAVYGSSSLPANIHFYTGNSGIYKFMIGTTCVGYIDGSGFHNGAP